MKTFPKLIFFAALVWLSSCSPRFMVNSDYDREVNFDQYHTYKIIDGEATTGDPVYSSPIVRRRIKKFIAEEMNERGYQRVDTAQADMLIRFSKDIEHRDQTHYDHPAMYNMGYGWGWGPGWFGSPFWGGPAWYGPRSYASSVREGRLIINIYDSKTDQLIWQGWAIGEVNGQRSARDREKAMERKVSKIMDKFPPHK